MIRAIIYSPETGEIRHGEWALVDDWRRTRRGKLWVDLEGEDQTQEHDRLINWLGINPLAVTDAQRDRHPPKAEVFDDYTFLLFKELRADVDELDSETVQLALFIGDNFLVTRHSGHSGSCERQWLDLQASSDGLSNGLDYLAIRIVRGLIDRYLQITLGLEVRLEELENEMFESPRDDLLTELSRYKSELRRLRRFYVYMTQVVSVVRETRPPGFSIESEHHVNDAYEQLERLVSLSGLYQDLVSDLMEGYLSLSSHRLNQIMKVLTVITAIFVPLSFLAGIYGMNFQNMPELSSKHGYFLLLLVMAAIAASLIALFRRRGWV